MKEWTVADKHGEKKDIEADKMEVMDRGVKFLSCTSENMTQVLAVFFMPASVVLKRG